MALNLCNEIALSAVARVPDLHDFGYARQSGRFFRRVIPDGDKTPRSQHYNQRRQKLFSHGPLVWPMRSVAERVAGLMGMKGKYVPEKHSSGH